MAMSQSKPEGLRRRTNKTTTRSTLSQVADPVIPDLPAGVDWHPRVEEWWAGAWASPMAPEWDPGSDVHNLYVAARLMQQFWDEDTSPGQRTMAAAEIRQQIKELGLTPMSRRSLQWEIEKGEQASERTQSRRNEAGPKRASGPDPRLSSATG